MSTFAATVPDLPILPANALPQRGAGKEKMLN